MSSGGESSDDKVVVDVAAPAAPCSPRGVRAAARADELPGVRAKGTREQLPLPRPPDASASEGAPRERDLVEVLRLWPHSSGAHGATATLPRATLRAPSAGSQLDDKIVLAHLALDLYRELEQLQARSAPHASRGAVGVCRDPSCAERTDALRGALIEACLLVQRVALLTPAATSQSEVDDRVRSLLALIDH
jgi:hypothetical protein